MRLGTLSFRQNWLDREISPSLTAAAMFGIGLAGFFVGVVTTKLLDSWNFQGLVLVASKL